MIHCKILCVLVALPIDNYIIKYNYASMISPFFSQYYIFLNIYFLIITFFDLFSELYNANIILVFLHRNKGLKNNVNLFLIVHTTVKIIIIKLYNIIKNGYEFMTSVHKYIYGTEAKTTDVLNRR